MVVMVWYITTKHKTIWTTDFRKPSGKMKKVGIWSENKKLEKSNSSKEKGYRNELSEALWMSVLRSALKKTDFMKRLLWLKK